MPATGQETQSKASQRNRRRSGQVLVEMALTMLPTFALIFAFVDFGLLLFRWSTLQNAVREGCRYAITFQTTTGHQDTSIEAVVQQYAFGMVKTTDVPQHIFVNYYTTTAMSTPIAFASGGNVPGNIVEVSVQNISWAWLAPLSGTITGGLRSTTPIGLNVYSSDILGGFPAGTVSVPR